MCIDAAGHGLYIAAYDPIVQDGPIDDHCRRKASLPSRHGTSARSRVIARAAAGSAALPS